MYEGRRGSLTRLFDRSAGVRNRRWEQRSGGVTALFPYLRTVYPLFPPTVGCHALELNTARGRADEIVHNLSALVWNISPM